LNHLAKDVIGEPFECFLSTGRARNNIADSRNNLLHTNLAVVRFELGKFLKAESDTNLIASSSTDKTVNLMEIKRRQLIDDYAYRYVLSLTSIDTSDQSVQDKGVQCANNALHFRVIGNKKIAWIRWITDFQIEIISIFMKYPIRFLGGQT